MNVEHVCDQLHARLDLDPAPWPDDCLRSFVGYAEDTEIDALLRDSLRRRRLAFLRARVPAHLAAADDRSRRACALLLQVLSEAPSVLVEHLLESPALEGWLCGPPTADSVSALGGFLAAAQLAHPDVTLRWSAGVAPLHLGRVVVTGLGAGVVDSLDDGSLRVTGDTGVVEIDPTALAHDDTGVTCTGTAVATVLPRTRLGELVLDGLDPRLRETPLPVEPLRAGEARAQHWVDLVDAGTALLESVEPPAARQVRRALRVLVPHEQLDGRVYGMRRLEMISSTAERTVGAFGISLGEEDPLQIAESLVHEHAHTRLRALLWDRPMHRADNLRYEAPWRRDPRPISGLVQGIAAFTLVTEFYRAAWQVRCADAWPGADAPSAASLLSTMNNKREEVLYGIRQALDADELLSFGRDFLLLSAEVLSRASDQPVSSV
ncbi:HEXXH motif-containing putative peptide modification protein [Lentzea sp. NBRC 102530]|uniref:aKG-HExxH-type peptide beta-hydroxylase n=1 Tax=Lentzea sp. NBRC 102530 TaxID=3032201 RepID=UPI0024A17419|nr:HEXXH motif-containing putative peptide modification protein [Lentzea sp. NBRC 102530]GLY50572.1 hypothetical protein Lesp01_42280 [Lentzea sp. NBRC 102530]